MAIMQQIHYNTKKISKAFGDGLNQAVPIFDIKDTELSHVLNLCGGEYPALTVRPGRPQVFTQVTTPNALGHRNNQYLHVLDGTVWKYWDGSTWQLVQSGLTSAKGKFTEFSTGTTQFTILSTNSNVYSYNGTTASNLTAAPLTRYYAAHKGRIYALKDKTLSFSALNLITNWTTINDSGSIVVNNMQGNGSAIVEFADHIIVFSELSMHELYGTGPLNYRLVDVSLSDGCISDKSIKEVNGVLYWLDNGSVKGYTGSRPIIISDKVKDYIEGINSSYKANCVAGTDGESYFLSIPYNSATNNIILQFDTRKGTWYVHSGSIVDFVNINDVLYGVDTNGYFYNMQSGTTDNGSAITWELITKAYNDGVVSQKKELQDITITADLAEGSSMNIYYSSNANQDNFTLLQSFTGVTGISNYYVMFPVMLPFDWYRIKITGSGSCTLHNIEIKLRVRYR